MGEAKLAEEKRLYNGDLIPQIRYYVDFTQKMLGCSMLKCDHAIHFVI